MIYNLYSYPTSVSVFLFQLFLRMTQFLIKNCQLGTENKKFKSYNWFLTINTTWCNSKKLSSECTKIVEWEVKKIIKR